METPEGAHDLQRMALPLLLNLEPPVFLSTLEVLQPAKMRERLHRLHEQIEGARLVRSLSSSSIRLG